MPILNIQDLQTELDTVARVWTANPDFKLKTVSLDQFNAKVAGFKALIETIAEKDDALVTLRNDRNAQAAELRNVAVRVRSGIKGVFGDDSNEYELAGGTPTSKRRKRNGSKETQPTDVAKAA